MRENHKKLEHTIWVEEKALLHFAVLLCFLEVLDLLILHPRKTDN